MPPRRAVCAGTGNICATPTTRAASRRSGSPARARAIVGQYATMPVQVTVTGQQVRGSWGMDVMVAPERQRQGLGEILFRTWDRNVGASLGLGLSESSYRLFNKLRWPDVGPLPCLVKPLTRRAFRHTDVAGQRQSTRLGGDAADREDRCANAATRRGSQAHTALRRQLHPALGLAGEQVRLRGPARRGVLELEVRVGPARALRDRSACAATIATSVTRSTAISESRAAE